MTKQVDQAQGAKELVDRARCLDQNAIAMIAMIRRNADAGNPKASTALTYILDYLQDHPSVSCFGEEQVSKLGIIKAADLNHPKIVHDTLASTLFDGPAMIGASTGILSHCKPWTKGRIVEYASMHGDAGRNLFMFGVADDGTKIRPVANRLSPDALGVVCAGHCIGNARRIQLARMKKVPISVLGSDIGWELGQ